LSATPDWLRLVPWGHLFYPEYRDLGLDAAGIDGLMADPVPNARGEVGEIFGAETASLTRLLHHVGDRACPG
jgi:hypothetical protein